jgi:hypothetical protein
MKKVKEKYKLFLNWEGIEYLDETTAKLKGAFFSGPALKIAAKIDPSTYLDMDLTPQNLTVLGSYYIVRLSWKEVRYFSEQKVGIEEVFLRNKDLKSLHKLGNKDSILINTEKHEEKLHPYNFLYESYTIKPNGEEYKYSK